MESSGNEKDVEWELHESSRFSVYASSQDRTLGKYGLNVLEGAIDDISYLIGVQVGESSKYPSSVTQSFVKSRFEKIPVVVSSRSAGASFANFINQGLEIHARYGEHASLFQHELSHRLMYEQIDLNLGPAFRAIFLAMIPTWWIEGFPEAMTQSMGRLDILGVSKTMALKQSFLTYDRLNSLYNASGDVSYRGYITSGRFFQYVVDQTNEKSFRELHKSLFWKLLTPPFVLGVDWALEKHTGKDARQLYSAYQEKENKYWKEVVRSLPNLIPNDASPQITFSNGPGDFVKINDQLIWSDLDKSTQPSAILVKQLKDKKTNRFPLQIEGSGLFDMIPEEQMGGGFWTTQTKQFSNRAEYTDPIYIQFKGNIAEINPSQIQKLIRFGVSTPKHPYQVRDIVAVGQGKAFALLSVRGIQSVFLLDAHSKSSQLLKTWPLPAKLTALKKRKAQGSTCLSVIVDWDLEKTSLEEICMNGKHKEIYPQSKVYFLSGVEEAVQDFTLVVGWGGNKGIAKFKSGQIQFIAPFREFSSGLYPFGPTKESLATFIYNGSGDYDLFPFQLNELQERFERVKKESPSPAIQAEPTLNHQFHPPFVELAKQLREKESIKLELESEEIAPWNAIRKQESSSEPTLQAENSAPKPAPYTASHVFTYPLIGLPFLGGLSLGFVSWPLLDDLWRYRVEAQGEYSFETGKFSGALSYINNRVADGLVLSAYSREKFNGFSHWGQCEDDPNSLCYSEDFSVTSMLRENGFSLGIENQFLPSTWGSTWGLHLSQIDHSSGYRFAAHRGNLLGLENGYNWTPWNRGFYLRDSSVPGGNIMDVNIKNSFGGSVYSSLGKVTDGRDREKKPLKFYKIYQSLSNNYYLDGHSLSFRGKIGATLGPQTLNLKEYYQPYRTYLAGAALNGLNFGLLGQSGIFDYSDGFWSWSTDASYTFPLIRSIDKQITIAYIDNLKGEIVLGRGGVAKDRRFSDLRNVTSISAAAKMTIDIRGFGIFPSLAFGRLIGRPGWSLFFQLNFTDFS